MDKPNTASLPSVPDVAALKKAQRQARKDFDLHVGLIMRSDEVPIATARVTAYVEGVAGLVRRLS